MQLRTSATKGINIYGIKLVSYSVTFLLIKVCPHLSISLSVLQKKCLSPMFIALAVTMFNFLIKCEYSKLRMSDDPLRLQDSRMSWWQRWGVLLLWRSQYCLGLPNIGWMHHRNTDHYETFIYVDDKRFEKFQRIKNIWSVISSRRIRKNGLDHI